MSNKVGPIYPDDVLLVNHIPEEVFEVFNDLILKNWNGKSAKVTQNDAAGLVAAKLNIDRDVVFNKCFLDVEDHYRKAGWLVAYEKPSYNETFEAYLCSLKPSVLP